jgi:RNA polymerase sigma factor (sigma-70 family)
MTEPGPDDPSHALERFTEDELLDAVRAGDTGAYAELYRRHRHEALRLARSLGTLHDPDDVAQEAFLKVLKAILRGAGPRRGFAPYLLRTVRNEAIDRARRTHEDAVEDLEHAAPDSFVSPDGVDELFDRQLVRTAFEGLPETWRRILWLTEVEGETPRALAPQLGRSPNAISQLSRRAREGLRAAWLQAHLDVAGAAPTCRSVAKDLDAHENGRLDPARSAAVASHLATCTRCAAARDELRGLAVQLRAVLLPLVLGSPLLLEQLSADVAAVGPSADGGSAASASPGAGLPDRPRGVDRDPRRARGPRRRGRADARRGAGGRHPRSRRLGGSTSRGRRRGRDGGGRRRRPGHGRVRGFRGVRGHRSRDGDLRSGRDRRR